MIRQQPETKLGLYYENDYQKVPYKPQEAQEGNRQEAGFFCLIKTYFQSFTEIEVIFHCIGDNSHQDNGVIFLFPQNHQLYFPLDLTYEINGNKYTSILVDHLKLNKQLKNKYEESFHSLLEISESAVNRYKNEINTHYRFELTTLRTNREIIVHFRLCLKTRLISEFFEFLQSEQFTFVSENISQPQPNVLFFKSERPCYLDKLLENETPNPTEISNYIENALYVKYSFLTNRNGINNNNVNRKFYFICPIRDDQINKLIDQITFKLINQNVQRNNINILETGTFLFINLVQYFERIEEFNTLNTVFIISNRHLAIQERDIETLNQMKVRVNLISYFILYDSFQNNNNNKIHNFCKETYTHLISLLAQDNNYNQVIDDIINHLSPSNFVLNFSILLSNEDHLNTEICTNIISNLFTYKRKYKARHISKAFNFLALIPQENCERLYITLTYSNGMNTITDRINVNIHNPVKNNLLHKIITKKIHCSSFNTWLQNQNSNQPKSNYLHLLYQTIKHDGSFSFITSSKNEIDSVNEYVNKMEMFTSRFPVLLMRIENYINNTNEYILLPFSSIHNRLYNVIQYNDDNRIEISDLNGNTISNSNNNFYSMDHNDNISGMIVKIYRV